MSERRPTHRTASENPNLDTPRSASRRAFLAGVGGAAVVGGGLWVGLEIAKRSDSVAAAAPGAASPGFSPNAFVRVGTDDTVTVIIGKAEMGQGVYTALAQVLAEELDVDPARVRVEFAPVDPRFNHPFMPMQFTGGSMSTPSTFEQLRNAGATARALLVQAAAQRWSIDAATLRVEDGVVMDGERRATYGELADAAATLPVPEKTTLKDPASFRYIGKPLRRLDSPVKVTGGAQFSLDVVRPDMLVAVLARPAAFGAKLGRVDDSAARAVRGVVDVQTVPSGVAVLATNTWAARTGRDALRVEWDTSPNESFSSAKLSEKYGRLANTEGALVKNTGDVAAPLGARGRTIDVEYEVPFLAHACMEPLNCVAHVTQDRAELWVGTQFQSEDAKAVAAALGFAPAQVQLHTTFLGGGFGRRANPYADFVVEAALVARAAGRPVKVVWTREDDTRGGWYRPLCVSRVRASIDASGLPNAWFHRVVNQPVLKNSPFGPFATVNGLDPTSTEGIDTMPYAIPNLRVEVHDTLSPVPVQWWRSVGHSHTAFVVNGVLDELAQLGRRDPVELRRELLKDKPRHLAVLNAAAERAGWGRPRAAGHHLGVALQESFGSIVAQVAEVSVSGTEVRVHRVTCAVDCGLVVNPGTVVAQMESGIVYGLSAALRGEITVENGRVLQGNFNDYPVLRMNEMPFIDTILVASDGPMGGAGEPGTPPIAPAVCNAIFAATGKRLRKLPISASLA